MPVNRFKVQVNLNQATIKAIPLNTTYVYVCVSVGVNWKKRRQKRSAEKRLEFEFKSEENLK